MAFTLTKSARLASEKLNLEPQLVLEIDGVDTRYGIRVIKKKVKIGDPEVIIGSGWKIGGTIALADQSDIISLDGSSSSIRQQLQPDKGLGSSISSMQVALVDKDLEATELVSPGIVVDDILGRRAKVWLGFADVAFPDDYVPIFRGIVDDIQMKAGMVVLNIAHPDQKKRQNLFPKAEGTLSGDITDSDVGITTDELAPFFLHDGAAAADEGLITYVKIDDEWLKLVQRIDYTYQVSRAQLGTTAAAHTAGSTVTAMYCLKGNVIDLALWLMLSNEAGGTYAEVQHTSIVYVDGETTYANGIFFAGVDMAEKYGITAGDSVAYWDGTTNLMTLASGVTVEEVIKRYDGTVIVVSDAVTLSEEREPLGPISFYSQFDVLPTGLGMKPDEVDIAEHLRVKRLFLSSFEVELYIKDDENIKELIEKELYAVAGAYSLPRKSQASVGLHIGPIPGTDTKILNRENIKNPAKLQVRRSLNTNFYNTIIYKIDKEPDGDEFAKGIVTRDADSTSRIPVGTKARIIEARGLRTTLNGQTLATQASNRLLNRYKYGAEYIEAVEVLFKTGYAIEIGDIVLLDGAGLGLANTAAGTRSPEPKLYEVVNKAIDIKSGNVSLSLVDTNFQAQARYGLIGPSSRIKSGLSQTQFVIEAAFSTDRYGTAEGMKWTRFLQAGATVAVKVRSGDFTTRYAQTTLSSVAGNTVTVADALGFTPQAGDVLELAQYSQATESIKLLYAHLTSGSDDTFADGTSAYVTI